MASRKAINGKKKSGLSESVKKEIAAIVGTGCPLETAAKYAGCRIADIKREQQKDETFQNELTRAEELAEIYFVRQIKKAAQKEQYWRAAAWALERRIPGRYAARSAASLSVAEIRDIFGKLAEIVLAEVSQKEDRKKIIARVEKLLADISAGKIPSDNISSGKSKSDSSAHAGKKSQQLDGTKSSEIDLMKINEESDESEEDG